MNTLQEITRDQWLADRRLGIGGSDVAAIAGVSPFKSPYEVWLEKTGAAPPQVETARQRWGKLLEPAIRQAYSDQTGRAVRVPSVILRNPERPFMLANIDGLTDDRRLLEIKRVGYDPGNEWGEPGTDQVPDYYLFQVQHYFAVAAEHFDVADVALLLGVDDFRIYTIEPDRELQEMLVDIEAEFWHRVVTRQEPPASTANDLRLRYPKSLGKAIEASIEIMGEFGHFKNLKAAEKDVARELEAAKTKICAFMGEADTLTCDGQTLATWKSTKDGTKFDEDKFAEVYPDIYNRFQVTRPGYRRFLPKK